jgi:catechol 2,3-dioxygenase-like lactoylglutathione lyase family enzyme
MRGRVRGDGSTPRRSRHDFWGVVLEAPDATSLAHFYAGLLGWEILKEEREFVTIAPPDGVAYLAFQTSAGYVPPVWPPVEGRQQMMMHLDLEVSDLELSVAHALEAGARLAEHQPQEDVRVLLDPVGHPFCLYVSE